MKRISNRIYLGLAALTTGLSMLAFSPAMASAADNTSSKETLFCTTLPATITKINSSISSLSSKLSTAQANRTQNLSANWTKADQTLAADRATWASQRQTQFSKLEAKATTDAEKTAVTTFETTITAAINTRESANDAARATYRTAVTNLVSTKQSTVNGQVTTFTDAVNAAEATATASCQSNPSDASIHTTFQAALKSARMAYSGDRGSDSSITSEVKALAQTRDTTEKANDATFQAAATAAETALKAAF